MTNIISEGEYGEISPFVDDDAFRLAKGLLAIGSGVCEGVRWEIKTFD